MIAADAIRAFTRAGRGVGGLALVAARHTGWYFQYRIGAGMRESSRRRKR